MRRLGETIHLDFTTHNVETGNIYDADSTPTCAVFEDDNDTPMYTPTVTKRTGLTGHYRVPMVMTAANGFEIGKSYNVAVTVVMGGITAKSIIDNFELELIARPTGSVVSDAGNSSTVFVTTLAETASDCWKDCLLIFTSGSLINQVKKISGYNGSTKAITVSSAFTETPSASGNFVIVNF